jgi:hypothetical protein
MVSGVLGTTAVEARETHVDTAEMSLRDRNQNQKKSKFGRM